MADRIQQLIEIARNQIDPDERSKTLKEISRLDSVEREKRSKDMIMVHNIHKDDYVVVWDKYGENLRILIPAEDKDVGEGKGNKTVPRFIADKFLREIIIKVITETSEVEFAKISKKYNGNHLAGYEEQNAIRTNNVKLWEKYAPMVFLGVVSKYGEDESVVNDEEDVIVDLKKGQEDVLQKLNLSEKRYVDVKEKFIKEVTKDAKPKGQTVQFISNK